ncbi:Oxysterol-binding protein-like C23H4.01c [Colletotrichum gloeosporioides]|uniref:Oxysterol-binding protein n=2 Tax=Colletotrichum gloeosporioides TaxID=474922 RepID=T0JIW7_COLGC|nr:Oxysterol-binding protein-like C23H4.01c [Colletotrichum gloeosporioides]EQB43362.1 oxysterol-binding protein [Colletotrichum gloeosporioides Cg-14]KAF3809078.1 Oxysterol-binding protein-like C23H4.01c [Colletotrichum gloeosporioides]
MAGIEQLEIHSKSYIVRWVKVDEGHTISWSVQPHKKSINFGIVKHPGTGATGLIANQNDDTATAGALTSGVAEPKGRFAKRDSITAQDQLSSKGFIPVKWHGKCDADKVSTGTWDVEKGQGGMFGLVFDNTFSKQISKTATFVLLTYPTGAPPQTTANAFPNLQAANASASRTSLPQVTTVTSASQDSLHSHKTGGGVRPTSASGRSENANYHTGILHKRRRKKGQGYARRFFSLDYSSCTLSYYYNRNSSALRGAIPLSLAAIAADERRREINIDSGAEIWHLRASNAKDFNDWARALEKASRAARGLEAPDDQPNNARSAPLRVNTTHLKPNATSMEEDREWQQVETLVSRMVGTRDALRRLVKDMSNQRPVSMAASSFLSPTSMGEEPDSYFPSPSPQATEQQAQRRPFWKRKSSNATPTATTPQAHQASAATALAVPAPNTVTTTISSNGPRHHHSKSKASIHEEKSTQEHCASLLNDLDSVVSEFTTLIANSKRRRAPAPLSAAPSRRSMETMSTDEFFDAEAGETSSQIVRIAQSEDESPDSEPDEGNLTDSSSISSAPESDAGIGQDDTSCYPAKPKSLSPLPVDISITRRTKVPPALVQPPSLIAFVRKNVGKDLSTISMPVSANEPISLLQRVAEQLEYAQLLDQAARAKEPKERLLYVTAFAVSQFSSGRAKERAIRKPFNPLLGETYEMLRTEQEVPGGFRLLVEKVCHRPVRLAMQADSANWSFSQSPAPSQKFWGKSAEITTEGRVRVALRLPDGTDELYSWTHATMFLRNVVMGEKYVEPVGVMPITNDTTGAKASVEFRSKGMFGGRGEDVQVETYGPDGVHTGSSLSGTWTGSLRVVEAGKAAGQEIWRVGKLVDNAANTYGMTTFAAALNEVTDIEKDRLPPTDSRLRPDQRLAEKGDLDQAEEWKVKLEEAQRARRRVLEEKGEEHRPKWFVKVGQGPEGEEVWKLRTGKDSYWEERSKGTWTGLEEIFSG